MRKLFILFIVSGLVSCDHSIKPSPPQIKILSLPAKDSFDYQSNFNKCFDVSDLKKFPDKSQFLARLIYAPAFHGVAIIELDEMSNTVILTVKQPVVEPDQSQIDDPVKPYRSLPFNQLCYWYSDKEAREIKKMFLKYSNNQIIDDECRPCLDPSTWRVEIFDHGKYSSLTKDKENDSDQVFIKTILSKVKLTNLNRSIHK